MSILVVVGVGFGGRSERDEDAKRDWNAKQLFRYEEVKKNCMEKVKFGKSVIDSRRKFQCINSVMAEKS